MEGDLEGEWIWGEAVAQIREALFIAEINSALRADLTADYDALA